MKPEEKRIQAALGLGDKYGLQVWYRGNFFGQPVRSYGNGSAREKRSMYSGFSKVFACTAVTKTDAVKELRRQKKEFFNNRKIGILGQRWYRNGKAIKL